MKELVRNIGIIIISASLILNPWVVGKIFTFSGTLNSNSKAVVIVIEIILLTIGIVIIKYKHCISEKSNEIMLLLATVLTTLAALYFLLINFYAFGWENAWVHDEIRHHMAIPNIKFKLYAPDYNNITEVYLKRGHTILTTKTNSLGFVDDEIVESNKRRIVVLGDSFTEGNYINENFVDILERKLNEKEPKYEVINAGLGSYSPIIEYNLAKHAMLEIKPQIIILNLDMTDVANDFVYEKQTKANADGYTFVYDKPPIFINSYFEKVYYKFRLVFGIFESFVKSVKKEKMGDTEISEEIKKRIRDKKKSSGNIELDTIYAYSYKNETEFKLHLNRTLKYIQKIDKLAKENNITFVLHSYPHSPQISLGYECFRDTVGLEKNKIYSSLIFDELSTFSERNNIKLLLSKDVLKNSKLPPYYPCDMHFNQHGHILIGNFLFEEMKGIAD